MKRVGRLDRACGKSDGAAIGRRRGLAVDRFRHRKSAGLGPVENAVTVDPPGRDAERAQQRIIKRFCFFQVAGPDHDVRKHPAFLPNVFLWHERTSAGLDTEASRSGFSLLTSPRWGSFYPREPDWISPG